MCSKISFLFLNVIIFSDLRYPCCILWFWQSCCYFTREWCSQSYLIQYHFLLHSHTRTKSVCKVCGNQFRMDDECLRVRLRVAGWKTIFERDLAQIEVTWKTIKRNCQLFGNFIFCEAVSSIENVIIVVFQFIWHITSNFSYLCLSRGKVENVLHCYDSYFKIV